MNQQVSLFMAFFRVGIFGYGGGPSMIPLVQKEVVEKHEWIDEQDFSDLLALGNTLPGPIATKMAGYIGYRVAGFSGMINAVLATILPTIILMIVLLTTLDAFSNQPWVKGMTYGVMPVVGVMLGVLTWQFFRKGQQGMGWTKSLVLTALSVLLLVILPVPPAVMIAALLLFVLLKPSKKNRVGQTSVHQEESG
ncbi:MAG TPA: chromate transporter [Bacillales bacterium]